MPIHYHFVDDVLVGRAIGTYPLGHLGEVLRAAVTDPDRPELRGALLDVRASAVVSLRTTQQLRDSALLIASMSRWFGRRVALLAESDVQFGVMRMVSAWAENAGTEVAVFRNEAEAFDWVSR